MIWIFLAVVLILLVNSAGFRKFILIGVGALVALLLILAAIGTVLR